jgi:hypothetical protein
VLKNQFLGVFLIGMLCASNAFSKETACSVDIWFKYDGFKYNVVYNVSGINTLKTFAKYANVQILDGEGTPTYADQVKILTYPGETFSEDFETPIQYVKFSKGPTDKQKKALAALTPEEPTEAQKKAIEILAQMEPSLDEKKKKFSRIIDEVRKKQRGFTCEIKSLTR